MASGALARLRTYLGLGGMEKKLDRLLTDFRFAAIADVFPVNSRMPISIEPLGMDRKPSGTAMSAHTREARRFT